MAILEDRPDAHRERLAAGVALAQAGPGRLALEPPDFGGIDIAAMRANRTIGPAKAFQMLPRLVVIVEDRVRQISHGYVSLSY